jgi:NNP family nitrate/nitrite transporter-like MFS transporter
MFGLMNIFSRASGGALSDLMATRFGMRGRLWVIFILQILSGAFCIVMSSLSNTLGGTIAAMIIFSIFCQQSCGANYGAVPFVSRRAYGGVAGLVGAMGNLGSIITQLAFFNGSSVSPQ